MPLQNHSTWLNLPFQLNSQPNSSQSLKSSELKKTSHLDWVMMLLGPTMDTFEAQGECQAKKIDPDQEKGAHSSQWAMYFAAWSPEEIFVQTVNRVLLWQSGEGSLSLDILVGGGLYRSEKFSQRGWRGKKFLPTMKGVCICSKIIPSTCRCLLWICYALLNVHMKVKKKSSHHDLRPPVAEVVVVIVAVMIIFGEQ